MEEANEKVKAVAAAKAEAANPKETKTEDSKEEAKKKAVKDALAKQEEEEDAEEEKKEKKKRDIPENNGVTATKEGEAAFDQEKNKEKAEEEAATAKADAQKAAVGGANKKALEAGKKGIPWKECGVNDMSRGECWTAHMPESAYDLAQKNATTNKTKADNATVVANQTLAAANSSKNANATVEGIA